MYVKLMIRVLVNVCRTFISDLSVLYVALMINCEVCMIFVFSSTNLHVQVVLKLVCDWCYICKYDNKIYRIKLYFMFPVLLLCYDGRRSVVLVRAILQEDCLLSLAAVTNGQIKITSCPWPLDLMAGHMSFS